MERQPNNCAGIDVGMNKNKNNKYSVCCLCSKYYRMPHDFCCLKECGLHEMCRGCRHGIYSDEYKEERRTCYD